ncbi:alpha/beta hydrolase [Deinococcus sp. UYEF24]
MSLEPEIQAHLQRLAALPAVPMSDLNAYREGAARSAQTLPRRDLPIAGKRDLQIHTPDAALPARLYAPLGEVPTGLLVYFHGGGWAASDIETHDALCTDLCSVSGVRVLSVAYRLAPEFRFPIPLDDCWHATLWAAQNAAELGADPARLAVGGDSAGGNLAAAVTLRAPDLSGLPPALILTAEYDPLRDDGVLYAEALEKAGVDATHLPGPGLIHTFARLAALSPGSAAKMDAAAAWLGQKLL